MVRSQPEFSSPLARPREDIPLSGRLATFFVFIGDSLIFWRIKLNSHSTFNRI
jgi:hypothetical protein